MQYNKPNNLVCDVTVVVLNVTLLKNVYNIPSINKYLIISATNSTGALDPV